MHHVTLIEDDALVRKLLEKYLVQAGWSVNALRDGRSVLEQLEAEPTDLILVDLGLPYLDGLAVVEKVRAHGINVPIIVLTAYDKPHLFATIRSVGADDLVQKPYDQAALVDRMARLMAA